jgi:hypothetical protein
VRRPEEPASRTTEPLVGFAPPATVLPFREAPPTPARVPPSSPARAPARRAVRAWLVIALAAMVVLDAVLLFLIVRGLR